MRIEQSDIDLISRIYNTSLDPASWPKVLQDIAHHLGAAGAQIFELRTNQPNKIMSSRLFSENYPSEVVSKYLETFNKEEIEDQKRFVEASLKMKPLELISDIHLYSSLKELLERPNAQFMLKLGLKHRAGTLLNRDLVFIDRFSLQFDANSGPVTSTQKERASYLLPHIAKVISVSRPLEQYTNLQGIFSKVLDTLRQGVAILSPQGTVIFQNTEFERIVDDYDLFKYSSSGIIQCTDESLENRYHQMVLTNEPLAHGTFGSHARKEALVHELPNEGTALFVEICPISDGDLTGPLKGECRLITVTDSSRPVNIDLQRVDSFYSLSNKEKEVLELIALGDTNPVIADKRNRSLDTVKSQVATVMRKTNSSNRTELIHMVRNLSSVIKYNDEAG